LIHASYFERREFLDAGVKRSMKNLLQQEVAHVAGVRSVTLRGARIDQVTWDVIRICSSLSAALT
jgi:hypothetical protein